MDSIFLILSLSAVTVLGGDEMVVNMPPSNNWEIGMTMDMNFMKGFSPFTDDTLTVFQENWKIKKENNDYDAFGSFEMTTRITQSQEDKLEAIGVKGALELSYGMFSGDAHMSFAKDNVDTALDVSLIIKATAYGRKGQMSMSDTNELMLRENIGSIDLDTFKERYGSYLIVGYEYGGEIMYTSTHSVRKEEDKLAVAGGLSMSYKNAGFSISGSVDGNYDTTDIDNSYTSTKKTLIRPNVNSDAITQLVYDLELLSQGNPTTETFQSMSANAQNLLSGDKLDPIKAVVVPLETVGAVHDMFVSQTAWEDSVGFIEFLNEMFLKVKSLDKQLTIVVDGYKYFVSNEDIPEVVFAWEQALTVFSNEMSQLNTRQEIIDEAVRYYAIYQNVDWNADVMSADSFMYITARGLERQFDDAVMLPYYVMVEANPPPSSGCCSCTLTGYQNSNYGGSEWSTSTVGSWVNVGTKNDISSLKVEGPCSLRVADGYYGSSAMNSVYGTGSYDAVLDVTGNDNINSVLLLCQEQCSCTFTGYQHSDYRGSTWSTSTVGSWVNVGTKNDISSLKIDGPCSVRVADGDKGKNQIKKGVYGLTPSVDWIGPISGNDNINSVMLECAESSSVATPFAPELPFEPMTPYKPSSPQFPEMTDRPVDWSTWYQLHSYDLIMFLSASLVILCGAALAVSTYKGRSRRYMKVNWQSDDQYAVDVEKESINK